MKLVIVLMMLGLTACGKADLFSSSSTSPPPGCEGTIADFDSKVSQITQQYTPDDVVQLLGVPNAFTSNSYIYFTGGCNTYQILFSGKHVASIRS